MKKAQNWPGLQWGQEDGGDRLTALCGLVSDCRDRKEGLFLLEDERGLENTSALFMEKREIGTQAAQLSWKKEDLTVTSLFAVDEETGVWSRKDVLTGGTKPHQIRCAMARFVLEGGEFEVYSQYSGWQMENQGSWQPLHAGKLTLTNKGIRSAEGAAPVMMIRESATGHGIALHIMPIGNWMIRVCRRIDRAGNPYVLIEAGLSDSHLDMRVEAGDRLELPQMLIYSITGDGRADAVRLHSYLLKRMPPKPAPLIYNTWFCDFERLDLSVLRKQIAAAKEIGCEVFTVDAGWFGTGDGWWQEVGYWQEKQTQAFHGNLKGFADEVRAAGLEMGLWMEPERVGPQAPLCREHPEWMIPVEEGFFVPDLTNPGAFSYILGEVCRLIDTYGLKMMKLDFNIGMEYDPSGSNFYRYYQAMFRLMETLQEQHPEVFFENCTSGGIRCDLSMLQRFGSHFLSDTVNPSEVLKMNQGLMMRFLPGVVGRWTVVRQANAIVRKYSWEENNPRVMACGDAEWGWLYETDLDFMVLCSIMGAWALTSDLAGLSQENKNRLKEWADFYKANRSQLATSVCYAHTPEQEKFDRKHPVVLEYASEGKHWIAAYRLEGTQRDFLVLPQLLCSQADYVVEYGDVRQKRSGEEIQKNGVMITLDKKYSACLVSLRRCD